VASPVVAAAKARAPRNHGRYALASVAAIYAEVEEDPSLQIAGRTSTSGRDVGIGAKPAAAAAAAAETAETAAAAAAETAETAAASAAAEDAAVAAAWADLRHAARRGGGTLALAAFEAADGRATQPPPPPLGRATATGAGVPAYSGRVTASGFAEGLGSLGLGRRGFPPRVLAVLLQTAKLFAESAPADASSSFGSSSRQIAGGGGLDYRRFLRALHGASSSHRPPPPGPEPLRSPRLTPSPVPSATAAASAADAAADAATAALLALSRAAGGATEKPARKATSVDAALLAMSSSSRSSRSSRERGSEARHVRIAGAHPEAHAAAVAARDASADTVFSSAYLAAHGPAAARADFKLGETLAAAVRAIEAAVAQAAAASHGQPAATAARERATAELPSARDAAACLGQLADAGERTHLPPASSSYGPQPPAPALSSLSAGVAATLGVSASSTASRAAALAALERGRDAARREEDVKTAAVVRRLQRPKIAARSSGGVAGGAWADCDGNSEDGSRRWPSGEWSDNRRGRSLSLGRSGGGPFGLSAERGAALALAERSHSLGRGAASSWAEGGGGGGGASRSAAHSASFHEAHPAAAPPPLERRRGLVAPPLAFRNATGGDATLLTLHLSRQQRQHLDQHRGQHLDQLRDQHLDQLRDQARFPPPPQRRLAAQLQHRPLDGSGGLGGGVGSWPLEALASLPSPSRSGSRSSSRAGSPPRERHLPAGSGLQGSFTLGGGRWRSTSAPRPAPFHFGAPPAAAARWLGQLQPACSSSSSSDAAVAGLPEDSLAPYKDHATDLRPAAAALSTRRFRQNVSQGSSRLCVRHARAIKAVHGSKARQ
jgi:hypothetical protein